MVCRSNKKTCMTNELYEEQVSSLNKKSYTKRVKKMFLFVVNCRLHSFSPVKHDAKATTCGTENYQQHKTAIETKKLRKTLAVLEDSNQTEQIT